MFSCAPALRGAHRGTLGHTGGRARRCRTAEYLAGNYRLDWSQASRCAESRDAGSGGSVIGALPCAQGDINYFRKRMVLEILLTELLGS